MLSKRCCRCLVTKPVAEFTRHRRNPDGLNYACAICARAQRAESRLSRIDREREYARANSERINLARRIRRQERPAVRERERLAVKAYYYANKAAMAEAHRLWSRANKEATQMHANGRRARLVLATVVPFTAAQLAARWRYYGGRCWLCGVTATATDHVKPLNKGGAHMLCNLRPICKPCNSAKRDTWPFALPERYGIPTLEF